MPVQMEVSFPRFGNMRGNFLSYQWSNGVTDNASIVVDRKGEYWVNVINQYGCVASDSIHILHAYDSPRNFISDKAELCQGEEIVLQPAKQFVNYKWSTGAVNDLISVKDPGTFHLSVTDQNGCTGKDTITVSRKQDCPASIWFTNAFTPNYDGVNDRFNPIIEGTLEKYSLKIYNRFGELVFTTNKQSVGWDGRFKGELLPVGSYVFTCNYKFPGLTESFKKGSFQLLR